MAPLREEICKIINNNCSREVVKQMECSEVLSDFLAIFNISRNRTFEHILTIAA
jgi:hypothetical protein